MVFILCDHRVCPCTCAPNDRFNLVCSLEIIVCKLATKVKADKLRRRRERERIQRASKTAEQKEKDSESEEYEIRLDVLLKAQRKDRLR